VNRFTPPTYDQIPTVDEMVAKLDRTVSGLEVVKRRLALTMRRFMVSAALGHDRPPQNVVIIGPSGGGKTFLVRRLLEACPVIWAESDATVFADTAYKGRQLPSMYLGLVEQRWRGARDSETGEKPWTVGQTRDLAERWGVVVIDEFDKLRQEKIAVRSAVRGERWTLQPELLKLVEGADVLSQRTDDDRGVMINTRNILHIAMGAFQGLNEIVSKHLSSLGITPPKAAYTKAGIVDLCDYGFLEELVGRFATILTLPPLDALHMARILREHIIPNFTRQCADDGIELVVDDGAYSTLAGRAAGLPIGARALAPAVEECLATAWARAQPGDRLMLTAQSVISETAVLIREGKAA